MKSTLSSIPDQTSLPVQPVISPSECHPSAHCDVVKKPHANILLFLWGTIKSTPSILKCPPQLWIMPVPAPSGSSAERWSLWVSDSSSSGTLTLPHSFSGHFHTTWGHCLFPVRHLDLFSDWTLNPLRNGFIWSPKLSSRFVHSGHLVNKGSVDGFYYRPPKRKLVEPNWRWSTHLKKHKMDGNLCYFDVGG